MSMRYHTRLVRKNSFRVEPERATVYFDEYAVAQLDHFIPTFRAVRGLRERNVRRYKLPCAREIESISHSMLETLNIRRPSTQTLSHLFLSPVTARSRGDLNSDDWFRWTLWDLNPPNWLARLERVQNLSEIASLEGNRKSDSNPFPFPSSCFRTEYSTA